MSEAPSVGAAYIGARVVRGPDWQYQEQDDGEGHLGTVTECKRAGVVTVQWDCGMVMSYRAGLDGRHELRIYDNAPCGVRHEGVACSECNVAYIAGLRWQCSACSDCNLCSRCYMSDLHDTSHVFKLYLDARSGDAVPVPPRKGASRLQAAGVLPGAVVMRSDSFKDRWSEQDDGGDDVSGKVLDIVSDSEWGCRNAVRVQWQKGPPRIYPVGCGGSVGVQYRIGANGCHFYPDHLPVLTVCQSEAAEDFEGQVIYKIGSRVWSDFGEEMLQKLGHFDPQMLQVRGRIGLIQRVTAGGDVVVEHYGPSRQFTYDTYVLYEATEFKVGDFLLVDDDENYVRSCQDGRFGWTYAAGHMVGKVVEVIKVHASGDVRVKFQNSECTLNPVCCTLVDKVCHQPMPSINPISSATIDENLCDR